MIISRGNAIALQPLSGSSDHIAYNVSQLSFSSSKDSVKGTWKMITHDHAVIFYVLTLLGQKTPLSDMPKKAINPIQSFRKTRESTNEIMEVMVYVDKKAVNFHGTSNIEKYIQSMLNIVGYYMRRF